MTEAGFSYWVLAGAAVFGFLLSLLVNSALLRRLKGLGSAKPKGKAFERWSAQSKPAVGGIGFYTAFIASLLLIGLVGLESDLGTWQIAGIILAASLAFVSGLADDAWHVSPLLKFLAQIACALILAATGTYIDTGNIYFSWLLSIFWVVALMNSLNMLDNMDGITSLVALVILAFFAVYSLDFFGEDSAEILLVLALIGALLGFLRFNLNPSRMFMGDSGSQFVGLILAAGATVFVWNRPLPVVGDFSLWHFLQIALLFLLPIADTTLVTINRIRYGRSPFQGGRDHSTHNLSYLGLSDRSIGWLYLILGILNALLALSLPLFITNLPESRGFVLLAYILMVILTFFLIARRNIRKGLYSY